MSKINGIIKEQNVRLLGNKRLMKHNPTVLNSPDVMIGCAILNERLIGPYLLRMTIILKRPTDAC